MVQLRPTSPLRPPGCVDQAVEILLKDTAADSVRAVVASGQNPYKMWRPTKSGYLAPLLTAPPGIFEPFNGPRQQFPATYWQTGHIDVIRPATIKVKNSMTGDKVLPIILDNRYAIDIDTEFNWSYAEWLFKHFKLPFVRPTLNKG